MTYLLLHLTPSSVCEKRSVNVTCWLAVSLTFKVEKDTNGSPNNQPFEVFVLDYHECVTCQDLGQSDAACFVH